MSVVQFDKPAVVEALKSAVEVGYRHFDTAFLYDTEGVLGEAINGLINNKLISRDDVYITTKVWLSVTWYTVNCVLSAINFFVIVLTRD